MTKLGLCCKGDPFDTVGNSKNKRIFNKIFVCKKIYLSLQSDSCGCGEMVDATL